MRTETPVQVKLADYTPYPFEIEHVALHFKLEPEATEVRAELKVRRKAGFTEQDMVLDGEALALKHLKIDGIALTEEAYEKADRTLTLYEVPDAFTLTTEVEINPSANTALSGLYISGGRFCTQCEAEGFRRITYWPDRPDVMSRFFVSIDADAVTYPILLSNGTPGKAGPGEQGRHFAEWDDPHLKPSYLFALCAGDYDVLRDEFTTMNRQHVHLAIHVDKGDAGRAEWAMESLKASMKWDEEVFGRAYDLGVFNIVAVRDFNFGAMENKGLNVFNSAYVLADETTATDADFEAIESIVGHEYFHNWTGNRITCRDWFQLCLKEGLTVFRDQEFSADMRSRPVQRIKDVIRLRARQFTEDGGPLAHAVRPNSYAAIDNLYTATVYEKGAELIRMLKALIGDEAFATGMQIYFDRHDGDAATIEDFYTCFENASGQDLSAFRYWYAQPGTPTITAEEHWDQARRTLALKLTQSNPKTPGNDNPHPLPMPIHAAAFTPDGQLIEETSLTIEGDTVNWTLSEQTDRPLLSLNRGFSAPVKLDHKIDAGTRLRLTEIDTDPFNIWDNLQSLIKAELIALTYTEKTQAEPSLIKAQAAAVCRSTEQDPAFAALLARLPDLGELFNEHTPADPSALKRARDIYQHQLALELANEAEAYLAQPSPAPFIPNAEQSGIRALRSAMITLTGALRSKASDERLKSIFDNAPNMTESLSSLRALSQYSQDHKETALSAFALEWADNPLVMDKWFAVQASTGTADEIAALTHHDAFDLNNPNRVRALIGGFAMVNLAGFHAPDGSGYRLVTEMIGRIDGLNPALAARLLTAFEQWRLLEPKAHKAAQQALQQLHKSDLSKNALDIISRTLG